MEIETLIRPSWVFDRICFHHRQIEIHNCKILHLCSHRSRGRLILRVSSIHRWQIRQIQVSCIQGLFVVLLCYFLLSLFPSFVSKFASLLLWSFANRSTIIVPTFLKEIWRNFVLGAVFTAKNRPPPNFWAKKIRYSERELEFKTFEWRSWKIRTLTIFFGV